MVNFQVVIYFQSSFWLYYDNLRLYLSIFCINAGTVYGGLEFPKLTFSDGVKLRVGNNKISLLSIAVGLPVSSLPL